MHLVGYMICISVLEFAEVGENWYVHQLRKKGGSLFFSKIRGNQDIGVRVITVSLIVLKRLPFKILVFYGTPHDCTIPKNDIRMFS